MDWRGLRLRLGLERPENETWTGETGVLCLREKRSAHKRFVTKPTTARPVCGQTALQCSLKVDCVQMWDRRDRQQLSALANLETYICVP